MIFPFLAAAAGSSQNTNFFQEMMTALVFLGTFMALVLILASWLIFAISLCISNSICRIEKSDFSKCFSVTLLGALICLPLGAALQWTTFGVFPAAHEIVHFVAAPLVLALLINNICHTGFLRSLFSAVLAGVISAVLFIVGFFATISAANMFGVSHTQFHLPL